MYMHLIKGNKKYMQILGEETSWASSYTAEDRKTTLK
jgi:hypothetical protein